MEEAALWEINILRTLPRPKANKDNGFPDKDLQHRDLPHPIQPSTQLAPRERQSTPNNIQFTTANTADKWA